LNPASCSKPTALPTRKADARIMRRMDGMAACRVSFNTDQQVQASRSLIETPRPLKRELFSSEFLCLKTHGFKKRWSQRREWWPAELILNMK
jgi:hypothetical protein